VGLPVPDGEEVPVGVTLMAAELGGGVALVTGVGVGLPTGVVVGPAPGGADEPATGDGVDPVTVVKPGTVCVTVWVPPR
jgi:hypothetical protein